jgi:hypothetical protein
MSVSTGKDQFGDIKSLTKAEGEGSDPNEIRLDAGLRFFVLKKEVVIVDDHTQWE